MNHALISQHKEIELNRDLLLQKYIILKDIIACKTEDELRGYIEGLHQVYNESDTVKLDRVLEPDVFDCNMP